MHFDKRYSAINYITKYIIPISTDAYYLVSFHGRIAFFFIVQQNVISLLLTSFILISVIFLEEYNLECHLLFKLFVSYNNYQLGNTGNKRGAASIRLAIL